jgi:hypothetical protein
MFVNLAIKAFFKRFLTPGFIAERLIERYKMSIFHANSAETPIFSSKHQS